MVRFIRNLNLKNSFKQGSFLAVILFFSVAVLINSALWESAEKNSDEQLRLAHENISRAIITCYAIEGRYPENFEYMKKNYGVIINEDKYTVYYSIFSENIMPDVTIIERQVEK